MDSWTPEQLSQMKMGGNKKCNDFLQQRGINARDPIKQKYESDAAQLYKAVLKARVEGKPEPTTVPKPAPKSAYRPSTQTSFGSHSNSVGATNNPVPKAPSNDPSGMERMAGESDAAYVARQTRLREEAQARMAAKFGSGGRMGGVGSDPSYNPNAGFGDMGVGSLIGGVSSLMGSVTSVVDTNSIKQVGGSFWGSLTNVASGVASTLTQPTGDDGLSALQQEFAQKKPMKSVYNGFGSDQQSGTNSTGYSSQTLGGGSGGGAIQECPGLPGEDRNGIQRLTGESDEQYVVRQTRLREEARQRMAAKFGGQGMGGVGSAPAAPSSVQSSELPPRSRSPPPNRTPPKKMNSGDFFESFGS
jgi:hypothetical protein